jgi:hypothetical protein
MKYCTTCDTVIPEGRLKILPTATTCINCSTEEKWSGGHIIHHKTGNEVCVIKDKKQAEEFHRMSSRAGFGTMRGMKPGVSGGSKSNGLAVGFIFQADEATFEEMGIKAMDMYELFGIDKLNRFLSEKVTERVISFGQSQKILKLINIVHTKEISQKNIKKYNPYGKFEPTISKGSVSKEIEESFKYWRK